ncbi:hypothetical protein D9M68_774620 [compost metagenome]
MFCTYAIGTEIIIDPAAVLCHHFIFWLTEEVSFKILEYIFLDKILQSEEDHLLYPFYTAFAGCPVRIYQCSTFGILSAVIYLISVCHQ